MIQLNQPYKVAIKVTGNGIRNAEEWKKAVVKFAQLPSGDIATIILSHSRKISQSDIAQYTPMHGYLKGAITSIIGRSDWESAQPTYEGLNESVEFFTDMECNTYTIKISTNREIVASVHGSTANRQPRNTTANVVAVESAITAQPQPQREENPYMLSNYTDSHIYNEFIGYHGSHRYTMNTPRTSNYNYRIGVELEVEMNSSSAHREFTETPRNWFFCEMDGSLRNNPCEIVTIPLLPQDAKNRNTWKPICDRLKKLGASSWDNNRCGLHVHVGREILGNTEEEKRDTLGKLLYFYETCLNDDATATKVFGRSRCYNEANHKSNGAIQAVNLLGIDCLEKKSVQENVKNNLLRSQNDNNRYRVINTTNAKTIEFRKGRGSLSADRIQAIITICESACLFCRETEDMTQLTADNFKEWIRNHVPMNNALYRYYDAIEADC